MIFRAATPDRLLVVRNAVGADAEAIARLYCQLDPKSAGVFVSPERLDDIAADPANILLVAEREERVIGTAFLTLCLDAMYGRQPFGVVDNIVVDASERSGGCGRLLMAAVDQLALRSDCSKLMLLSGIQRAEAHAFFETMGYDCSAKRGFVKYRSELESRALCAGLQAV